MVASVSDLLWVAEITSATTLVAGLGGIWLSGLVTDRTREKDAQVAREARIAAHETWLRERRAEAYVATLGYVIVLSAWAMDTIRAIEVGTSLDRVTARPPLDKQAQMAATLSAFASKEVSLAAQHWNEVIQEMVAIERVLIIDPTEEAALADFKDLYERLRKLHSRLAIAIAADLSPPTAI